MRDIDPIAWFGTRNVVPTPKHFVKSPTVVDNESLLWVIKTLKGRYSLNTIVDSQNPNMIVLGNDIHQAIFFEDPADAMIYELRWSGSK